MNYSMMQKPEKPIQTDLFGNVIINKEDDVYKTPDNVRVNDLSGKVETQYLIEIVCDDERDQQNIYNELNAKYKCRILTL